ncbi:Hypothetical_protein [Hexamita inflata]|uniref:Hypothetical_protein n=1 Tax=Hexamita inflata TaxID=28002 RepID=A0AA86N7S0_9EUKA|nr:Hypothetical protein HINF_LOCUS2068 [Hexamita inflata]
MFQVFNCRQLLRACPTQRCLGLRLLALLPHPRGRLEQFLWTKLVSLVIFLVIHHKNQWFSKTEQQIKIYSFNSFEQKRFIFILLGSQGFWESKLCSPLNRIKQNICSFTLFSFKSRYVQVTLHYLK